MVFIKKNYFFAKLNLQLKCNDFLNYISNEQIFINICCICNIYYGGGCSKSDDNTPKKPNSVTEDTHYETHRDSSRPNSSNNTPIRPSKPKPPKETYEVVRIEQSQSLKLNSATYIGFNKTTRAVYPLRLPENTVRFYYAVSATEVKSSTKLDLFSQINSKFTQGQPDISLNAIGSSLFIPKQATNEPSRIEVFLLDWEEERKFINKDAFSYYRDGSRPSSVAFDVVDVSQIGDRPLSYFKDRLPTFFYLGFRNPRNTTATYVNFEVVAIVKK